MCFGTATGFAIGGLASGLGAIGAGALGASGAKAGADAEAQAAADAAKVAEDTLAENKRQFDLTQQNNWAQYQAQQQRLAPYQGLAAGATASLANLLKIPIQTMPALPQPDFGTDPATAPTSAPASAAPSSSAAAPTMTQPIFTAAGTPAGTPTSAAPSLASMFKSPLTVAPGSLAPGVTGPNGNITPSVSPTAAGLVTMQGPNGQTMQVPANQVAQWQARGAYVTGLNG